jgi:pSer/pThr/pTyr-binding forkhead associated (FHA) protein
MQVTILLGADAGRVLTTGVSPVTIGRDSSNVLALNDERTPRFHEQITVLPNGAMVEDLGSTNGILVNGQPVPPRVPRRLQPGDQIKVGNTLLRFDGEKSAAQPLPVGQPASRSSSLQKIPDSGHRGCEHARTSPGVRSGAGLIDSSSQP